MSLQGMHPAFSFSENFDLNFLRFYFFSMNKTSNTRRVANELEGLRLVE
jgi:hypothetical protein